jgi:methionine-rich copper-binding protein CopC
MRSIRLRSARHGLALAGLLLVVACMLPGSVLAHERRTIANGKYDVVVGWDAEPTYADMKNAASIRIMQAGTTTPVTGAEKTLKLAIRQGASTKDFPLRAAFGQDGYYLADIVPTRVGDYQWMFTGTINGDQVNETFDTADGKFDGVAAPSALQFPIALADPAQSNQAVQAAQGDAQSARMLALVGIGVGGSRTVGWPRSMVLPASDGQSAKHANAGGERPSITMQTRRWVAAVAARAWLALLPQAAPAHANLDRAEPTPDAQLDQPPHALQLFFSEPVDSSFSHVQLLNAQGQSVDRGDSRVAPADPRSLMVTLPDTLPNGVYTVASGGRCRPWTGIRVNGAYSLIVGPMPAEGVAVATAPYSQATFAPRTRRWAGGGSM